MTSLSSHSLRSRKPLTPIQRSTLGKVGETKNEMVGRKSTSLSKSSHTTPPHQSTKESGVENENSGEKKLKSTLPSASSIIKKRGRGGGVKKIVCVEVEVQTDLSWDITPSSPSQDQEESVSYWKNLAMMRRYALNETIIENQRLAEENEALREDNKELSEMLEDAKQLAEMVNAVSDESGVVADESGGDMNFSTLSNVSSIQEDSESD